MSTLNWEGISIAVSHTPQDFCGPFDHIEIKCGQVLPITETGYRSHFLSPEELEQFDSPEAFVLEPARNCCLRSSHNATSADQPS